MANSKALDKRRKSIRNIRKITRTMELIATARFKKAMDRASAATSYTNRMTKLVGDLANAGLSIQHPLLESRTETNNATLLVLTSNRGLCGGYNTAVLKDANAHFDEELSGKVENVSVEVSGKRGISAFEFRNIEMDRQYTQFEDKPTFEEVEVLANRFLEEYATGKIDRLDVAYTRFENVARQDSVVETLLPLGSLTEGDSSEDDSTGSTQYEFFPSAESILEEVVPTSFKIKLFKCFLDAAVSEQIARMVAMKRATEAADDIIRSLSLQYNRARQSQITNEIIEIIGGASALGG
jgi:F-type H+-transporting ATPase subunit gamma